MVEEEYPVTRKIIISETDTSGKITYANKNFCEIMGYTKDELIGKNHNLIRHPDMPKVIFEKIWTTIKSGKQWQGIIKNLCRDGRYVWLDTEIIAVKDENDKTRSYIAAYRAVSQKNRDEAKDMYTQMMLQQNIK
jgi:aerotaxis receptor